MRVYRSGYRLAVLRIDFVTLFPEMLTQAVGHSILGRACQSGLVAFTATNPREFTSDVHRTVDDSPFGGGAGMVMKAEPVAQAIESLPCLANRAIVFTDPTGARFAQRDAVQLASLKQVVLVSGHYEGIDERVRNSFATHTFSIGDFVLTGGELASLVIADAVCRNVPGVLGSAASLEQDSHADGLLSAPQFTRPEVWRGLAAPEVLLSGDHRKIARWRRTQALKLTRTLRPDLFCIAAISDADLELLD